MPQGDPGGHMADTGGYGGNFGGVGGATNQSSSHGGNPTNMSGGVGNYGAVRSAMSRYNNAMGTNNPARAAGNWSRAQMQMNQRLGLVPGMGFSNPRASTGTGGNKGGPGRTPGTIPETVSPPIDPEAAKTIAAFLGYTKPVGIGSTSILGPQPTDPAFNVLSGISAPKAPTTRSVTPPGPGKQIADRIPEEQEAHNPIYGGFNPGLNDWTHTDWMDPGDWGAGPGAGHIGWNMGNVDQSGKPIGDQVPGRQFGGPVSGQTYTVGENGPETLHMAPGSSGMVIPNNPMDRAIGFQRRQFGGPVGMPGKQPSAGMAMPVNPTPAGAGRPATLPPQGGTAQPYLNNPYLTHYTDQAGLDAGIAAWNAAGGTNTTPPPGMPAHAPGVGEPGFVPGPPRSPDPTLGQPPTPPQPGQPPLGGMDPRLMRDQFQLMRQQKKSQPAVPPPPPAPPADPAMAAWLQQRPEWGGDPTQKMAFKDSIHAWKDQRPEWGGGHNGGQPPAVTPPATLPPAPTGGRGFGGNNFQPPQGGGNGTYGGGYRGNNNWNSANAANGTYGGGGRGFNNWNSANAGGGYGSPPFAPPMTGGFALSGLGQPGVMGQLRQRFGQG